MITVSVPWFLFVVIYGVGFSVCSTLFLFLLWGLWDGAVWLFKKTVRSPDK